MSRLPADEGWRTVLRRVSRYSPKPTTETIYILQGRNGPYALRRLNHILQSKTSAATSLVHEPELYPKTLVFETPTTYLHPTTPTYCCWLYQYIINALHRYTVLQRIQTRSYTISGSVIDATSLPDIPRSNKDPFHSSPNASMLPNLVRIRPKCYTKSNPNNYKLYISNL